MVDPAYLKSSIFCTTTHAGVSLTRPDDRSLVTKAESPDIRSPEVDYPPRLHKDEILREGTTPTKLNPKTADPTTKVRYQRSSSERATSTGSICDVGKKQPIKHSKSVTDTLSGGDCHQTFRCQHCVHDLSSSSDSGIELQPSLAPRRNSDPLLLPRHPGTSSNACGNPKGKKTEYGKVTMWSYEGICYIVSVILLCVYAALSWSEGTISGSQKWSHPAKTTPSRTKSGSQKWSHMIKSGSQKWSSLT